MLPGSPPRLRGALKCAHAGVDEIRITPAFAGSTWGTSQFRPCSTDHPRVCGEHRRPTSAQRPRPGSPPRLRGAPAANGETAAGGRITPAFAGSTSSRMLVFGRLGDHPRVCGEHPALAGLNVGANGSPPRLRGARRDVNFAESKLRITPAFAGSTYPPYGPGPPPKDHPRVCGEH